MTRKESLHRADSNVAASKTEPGAGQTGTAKRKKKKKEEVSTLNTNTVLL